MRPTQAPSPEMQPPTTPNGKVLGMTMREKGTLLTTSTEKLVPILPTYMAKVYDDIANSISERHDVRSVTKTAISGSKKGRPVKRNDDGKLVHLTLILWLQKI